MKTLMKRYTIMITAVQKILVPQYLNMPYIVFTQNYEIRISYSDFITQ